MEKQARERAERYAATCGCTFSYLASLGEGRFQQRPQGLVELD